MAESSVRTVAPPTHGPHRIRPIDRYDGPVTSQTPDQPPRLPGERRLAHPPSDRYRQPDVETEVADPAATRVRGVALGTSAALAGAAVVTFLGGVLTITSGLVVAAGAIGWTVAVAVRFGAGGSVTRSGRVRLAVGLALGAVVTGQVGLWAYARSEGGVLGPLDYLGEVFGPLVPLELLVAWIVAWATAR